MLRYNSHHRLLSPYHRHLPLLTMHVHQGRSGVREGRHLPPRSSPKGRRKRPGYLLRRPLHRLLQEGRSSNCLLRRPAARGVIQGLSNGVRGCSGVLPSVQPYGCRV